MYLPLYLYRSVLNSHAQFLIVTRFSTIYQKRILRGTPYAPLLYREPTEVGVQAAARLERVRLYAVHRTSPKNGEKRFRAVSSLRQGLRSTADIQQAVHSAKRSTFVFNELTVHLLNHSLLLRQLGIEPIGAIPVFHPRYRDKKYRGDLERHSHLP